MRTLTASSNRITGTVPACVSRARGWQRWSPYAAVAWSLIYAVLGVNWAVSGHGFPYIPKADPNALMPLAGQFGPAVAWIIVMMVGFPAAALGMAMLFLVRGRTLRPLFITAGLLLAGVLLLLMTDLNLLILIGYIPYAVQSLFTDAGFSQKYLEGWTQWATIHQLICLIGGFLWLAATFRYTRWSGDACPYCGRQNGPENWQSPNRAIRWGRVAVYVAFVAPIFYTLTRYAWAAGITLGMSEEAFRNGQENGLWISGLFLATFCLVGALLMFGLIQRWGEVFPCWMIGFAGRRVPIALAVVPASLVSVLLIVGGITMWSQLGQIVSATKTGGLVDIRLVWDIVILVGPILLFPVWGAALAVATLGYYYRRRDPCSVCGRGVPGEIEKPSSNAPMHERASS